MFAGRLDGIEVLKRLAPGLPPVNIDREQFKRLVVNLVDNAAEAMRESLVKRLYVGTTAPTSGPGGTDRRRHRLRHLAGRQREAVPALLHHEEPRHRAGLAIVNHIVSEHGAQIRVEDNYPAGARFIVEMPALAPAEMPKLQAVGAPRMRSPRVLVVDDEPGIRSRCPACWRTKATTSRRVRDGESCLRR